MKVTAKTLEIINDFLQEVVDNGNKIAGITKSKKGKDLKSKTRFRRFDDFVYKVSIIVRLDQMLYHLISVNDDMKFFSKETSAEWKQFL